MSEHVRIERRDGIQIVRLARPEKKNALTSPMYEALTRALAEGDGRDDVAATVILGLPGAFSAGNDIGEFRAYAADGALGDAVTGFIRRLAATQKPMIAGVDGLAIGIGTTMLMHCDLVYASERAHFRTPFLDLGLVPEAASSLLAPMRMGHARAFEMLVLGEPLDAPKALAAGLINAIVPPEELEAKAVAAAVRLAAKPPAALMAARRLVKGDPAAVAERMEAEIALFAERLSSSEAQEAFAAFLEKRPADFRRTKGGA